ncbi:MAG TPA: hypothetical protein VH914_21920 [Acidimicrobiia bacterium]|nr:hypothetical protein [Acidimicrobiia bacterium]
MLTVGFAVTLLVAVALVGVALRPRPRRTRESESAIARSTLTTAAPSMSAPSTPRAPLPPAAPVSANGTFHDLPDCIPVDSRSTSDVGCELKSDYEAFAPDPTKPGIPVYDDTGTTPGPIVGYIDDDIGQFVPIAIARDPDALAKLRVCNSELLRGAARDDGCRPVLEAMGTRLAR